MRNFSINTILAMILMSISYGGSGLPKILLKCTEPCISYLPPSQILNIAAVMGQVSSSSKITVTPILCQYIAVCPNDELPGKMDQIFHNLNAVSHRKYSSILRHIDDFKRGLLEYKSIYSEPVLIALSDLNHEVAELSCSFNNLAQNQLHDDVLLKISRMDRRNIQEREELVSEISRIQKAMSDLSGSWQNMSSKHNIEEPWNQRSDELKNCGGPDADSMKAYRGVQKGLKDMELFIQQVYELSSCYKRRLLDQPVSSVVPLVDDSEED